MTKSQERKVAQIHSLFEELSGQHNDGEFKKWEVTENERGTVCVYGEYGSKGDEGTLAEIFCRERAQIFIGKKGGAHYYNKRGTRKTFKGYSILQVVCDNR